MEEGLKLMYHVEIRSTRYEIAVLELSVAWLGHQDVGLNLGPDACVLEKDTYMPLVTLRGNWVPM